jgi:hypothetical protein
MPVAGMRPSRSGFLPDLGQDAQTNLQITR